MPLRRSPEEDAPGSSPMVHSHRRSSSTLTNMRIGINEMFNGRSRVGRARSVSQERSLPERPLDSPKTPRLVLGFHNLSSTRLAIPYLNRASLSLPSTPTIADIPPPPTSPRPVVQSITREPTQPSISTIPSHVRHNSGRRFVGVDEADLHLAELAHAGRRRRKQKPKKRRSCAPKIKHKDVRRKVLACIISGLILIVVLAIYLGMALINHNESQEFHVLLILIILLITIFFCHSLIRLCMLVLHPPSEENDLERQNMASMVGPIRYANPIVPIQVILARDEEAVGIESAATKVPPPAYGLWRESIRMNPNQLYWQRNQVVPRPNSQDRPNTATRPPSYISDDGIDYAVEAVPRLTTAVILPVHPSERVRRPAT